MTPILCPRCRVTLPAAELASGWCDACGLKLPLYIRKEAPSPPRDLGKYPQVDPEDYSTNYPEYQTRSITPEEAKQYRLSTGVTGWAILGCFLGAALGLLLYVTFTKGQTMTTGQVVLFMGLPLLLGGVLFGYLSYVFGKKKAWVVTSGLILVMLANLAFICLVVISLIF